ncbi:MAG: hypothetical protein JEZ11_08930 [Desulfobacterales bacterium]|nr:hypothetical protein [Desulfobacterales bacterium]
MAGFLEKHAAWLKNLTLLAVMGIPFLLYIAAMRDQTGLVYFLLGAMGLFMLIALKVE